MGIFRKLLGRSAAGAHETGESYEDAIERHVGENLVPLDILQAERIRKSAQPQPAALAPVPETPVTDEADEEAGQGGFEDEDWADDVAELEAWEAAERAVEQTRHRAPEPPAPPAPTGEAETAPPVAARPAAAAPRAEAAPDDAAEEDMTEARMDALAAALRMGEAAPEDADADDAILAGAAGDAAEDAPAAGDGTRPAPRAIWDIDLGAADPDDAAAERAPRPARPATPFAAAQPARPRRPEARPQAGFDALDAAAAEPAGDNPARRRRARTRLLGFEHSDGQVVDLFDAPAAPPVSSTRFPVGWLVIVKGPGRGESFTLKAGMSQIGRGEDQSVCLDFGDLAISRSNHAAIVYDPECHKFFLGHGGKSNIVRLNDRPVISNEELKNGDRIRLGETTLQFVGLCSSEFNWAADDEEGSDDVEIA